MTESTKTPFIRRIFKFRQTEGRIWLLDELRGLSILLMILHHAAYDAKYMFGAELPVDSVVVYVLHIIFASLFVLISGAACRLTHSNLKRGAVCFGCGLLITAVTGIVMPDSIVVFGILHMLGIAMMLFALARPALDKISPAAGIVVFSMLAVLTFRIPEGYVGIPYLLEWRLPRVLYSTEFLFFLGLPSPAFFSGDYFPLVPWLFVFIAGSYAGVYLKQRRCPDYFYKMHCRALAAVGQNTLVIYMLHQPVIYGLLYILFIYIIK